ncbi:aldehyde dehydrogenase family protein [Oricola thermophila]|uniref:Aldehyde dehydrogenase family protein n=1 Tax=Oricola thermophila TaxID=2742145 RepID=A0A6N1V9T6_9HYPH|nr:aldehyde dehydrogenase family protein [Oricola thermophila]QKV17283.1 aldehyde dehydrogenase family protein [Oricola thermophila]
MTAFAMTIDGQPITPSETFDVINPATGGLAGKCPAGSAEDVNAAVAAAKAAFDEWSQQSDETRRQACRDMARVLGENAEELARLLTTEQGKPLGGLGSRFELGGCQAWAANTAELELPVEVVKDDNEGRIEIHRKPLGVVASITPWNWPLMIAIWHIAPAIRAGNTVVIKPSPYTPLSTLRMVEILNTVLPAGVLNAVTGPDSIGPVLTSHPDVAKVTFTGSTETGKKVMANAAGTLKRLTLELGGNDAGIVLPDTDPKQVAEGIFWGAFINSGQTCACMKRLYVHDSIYDEVCTALVDFASRIPMGDGMDENNVLGPVQNAMQFEKVRELVEDAKANGARVLLGGEAPQGDGYFYPITLLADVTDGMRIVDEEQFGPVLPIIRYTDVEDALTRANSSSMGLGGSVWSKNIDDAAALALRLESGSAWVNSHGGLHPNAPFGGVKQSGIGTEFGVDGLKEFTAIQTLHR